jgi:hypothetical protein
MVNQASARDTARLRNRLLLRITMRMGATAAAMALLTTVWFFSNPDAKTRVSVSQSVAPRTPAAFETSPIVPTAVIDAYRHAVIDAHRQMPTGVGEH